jgi:hypothetical protein
MKDIKVHLETGLKEVGQTFEARNVSVLYRIKQHGITDRKLILHLEWDEECCKKSVKSIGQRQKETFCR